MINQQSTSVQFMWNLVFFVRVGLGIGVRLDGALVGLQYYLPTLVIQIKFTCMDNSVYAQVVLMGAASLSKILPLFREVLATEL